MTSIATPCVENDSTQELQLMVVKAVDTFLENDAQLLELKAHEQAISHRIAVYLERLIKEAGMNQLHVDCEYNKHLNGSKRIRLGAISSEMLTACGCSACEKLLEHGTPENKHFRPDIIAHVRRKDANNTIVIEIKKNLVCPFDLAKLEVLTLNAEKQGEYSYKLGVFLHFVDGLANYRWFIDGAEVHTE